MQPPPGVRRLSIYSFAQPFNGSLMALPFFSDMRMGCELSGAGVQEVKMRRLLLGIRDGFHCFFYRVLGHVTSLSWLSI